MHRRISWQAPHLLAMIVLLLIIGNVNAVPIAPREAMDGIVCGIDMRLGTRKMCLSGREGFGFDENGHLQTMTFESNEEAKEVQCDHIVELQWVNHYIHQNQLTAKICQDLRMVESMATNPGAIKDLRNELALTINGPGNLVLLADTVNNFKGKVMDPVKPYDPSCSRLGNRRPNGAGAFASKSKSGKKPPTRTTSTSTKSKTKNGRPRAKTAAESEARRIQAARGCQTYLPEVRGKAMTVIQEVEALFEASRSIGKTASTGRSQVR